MFINSNLPFEEPWGNLAVLGHHFCFESDSILQVTTSEWIWLLELFGSCLVLSWCLGGDWEWSLGWWRLYSTGPCTLLLNPGGNQIRLLSSAATNSLGLQLISDLESCRIEVSLPMSSIFFSVIFLLLVSFCHNIISSFQFFPFLNKPDLVWAPWLIYTYSIEDSFDMFMRV